MTGCPELEEQLRLWQEEAEREGAAREVEHCRELGEVQRGGALSCTQLEAQLDLQTEVLRLERDRRCGGRVARQTLTIYGRRSALRMPRRYVLSHPRVHHPIQAYRYIHIHPDRGRGIADCRWNMEWTSPLLFKLYSYRTVQRAPVCQRQRSGLRTPSGDRCWGLLQPAPLHRLWGSSARNEGHSHVTVRCGVRSQSQRPERSEQKRAQSIEAPTTSKSCYCTLWHILLQGVVSTHAPTHAHASTIWAVGEGKASRECWTHGSAAIAGLRVKDPCQDP